jgi:cytochrome b subunit of formate dehydrogenase
MGDTMFQTISIIAVLGTFAGIAVHWIATSAGTMRCPVAGGIHMLSLLLIEQRSSLLGTLKKLVYLLAVVCFLVLAITGFYPLLVKGEHISGYLMMIHATFAPVFALCLGILAVTWAGSYRFTAEDCPWVSRLLRRVTRLRVPADNRPWQCSRVVCKAAFWLLLVLALPLILSIIVSMFHLLGTDWQGIAMALHRWTALVFVIVAIIHTYLAARLRMV